MKIVLLMTTLVSIAGLARASESVTLAWDPSLDSDLAGYKIYYGPASGTYTNEIDLGLVTTNTVCCLTPGATYFFVVTVYNTAGLESDPSNEISYTVPTTTSGFRILSLKPDVSGGFTLTWESEPGASYRVSYMDTPGAANWTDLSSNIIADDFVTSWTNGNPRTFPSRFYKVRLVP